MPATGIACVFASPLVGSVTPTPELGYCTLV